MCTTYRHMKSIGVENTHEQHIARFVSVKYHWLRYDNIMKME
jgi:hypothetical protein